jgi:hypothetical protein
LGIRTGKWTGPIPANFRGRIPETVQAQIAARQQTQTAPVNYGNDLDILLGELNQYVSDLTRQAKNNFLDLRGGDVFPESSDVTVNRVGDLATEGVRVARTIQEAFGELAKKIENQTFEPLPIDSQIQADILYEIQNSAQEALNAVSILRDARRMLELDYYEAYLGIAEEAQARIRRSSATLTNLQNQIEGTLSESGANISANENNVLAALDQSVALLNSYKNMIESVLAPGRFSGRY